MKLQKDWSKVSLRSKQDFKLIPPFHEACDCRPPPTLLQETGDPFSGEGKIEGLWNYLGTVVVQIRGELNESLHTIYWDPTEFPES